MITGADSYFSMIESTSWDTSDNEMNENDVVVFNNFEDADNYVNGLEGSPKIIETELKWKIK